MVVKIKDEKEIIISEESRLNSFTKMDCKLLRLNNNETYTVEKQKCKETVVLLVEGDFEIKVLNKLYSALRGNVFDNAGFALHVPFNVEMQISTKCGAEIIILSTTNKNTFDIKFYTPEDVLIQRFGDGVWDNTGIRDVLTFFDYDNAPYSNLVLGEVFSLPGRWSSYPPHAHPHPEIYYYRFDKPQGFGAAFINESAETIRDRNFLLIPGGTTHPQCTAPGYSLYFSWMIRHIENNVWKKTRVMDEKHSWLEDKNLELWKGFKR